MEQINRRKAIKQTAILMGGAVSASTILGILNGCTPKSGINWKPQFLTELQAQVVTRMSDIIIPATETPGAIDVGVPEFIDLMVKDVFSKDEQDAFLEGLDGFESGSREQYGNSFSELALEDQSAYLKSVHDAAIIEGGRWPFVLRIKELTMVCFFTSEVGATKVLQYEAVPGSYEGCLPLQEVGKTWAS